MRLLLALLLLSAVPAEAFLFGRGADEKAAAGLGAMRDAFNRGDCPAVLQLSETFLEEKPPAKLREEAYGYIGRCYEASGSADKAIGLYKLAIGLYPANALFATRLALLYNGAGFPENAAPLFLKALELGGENAGPSLGLARSYAAMGYLSRAKEFYGKAAALQQYRDAGTLEEYARCLLRKRDWDEAAAVAARGRLLTPLSPLWTVLEARAQAGRGDYYQAAALMEGALRLGSGRQLRLERALYLLMGGLPNRAMAAVEPELAADPADPLAAAVKGMALYSLGRSQEAVEYFQKARRGGPFTAGVAGSFLEEAAGVPPELWKK
jgi:tetratricopeptide (TPR) repeat protein